jgi:hypothetical protein
LKVLINLTIVSDCILQTVFDFFLAFPMIVSRFTNDFEEGLATSG